MPAEAENAGGMERTRATLAEVPCTGTNPAPGPGRPPKFTRHKDPDLGRRDLRDLEPLPYRGRI